jgi:MFS family permease
MLTQVSVKKESRIGDIHRNKWLFIITRLDLTSMVVPVIVKIWAGANLNFSQMLFLQGIFSLSVVIFEIPSGAISDTFKRKYVIAAGYTFLALASLSYSLGRTFAVFAVSEVLFGIGLATISGSDTSLMYDTLANHNQEKQFKNILGKASTMSFLSAMIALMISGALGEYSLRWPLYILSATFAVKVVLSLFMIEAERTKAQSAGKATKKAFKTLIKSKFLIAVLISAIAYSVAQRVAFWSYQPKLFENNITTLHIGFIFAAMNLIAAGASIVFARLKEHNEDLFLLGFMIIELVNIIILWYFDSLVILSTMLLVQVARGGRAPIVGTMIQRKATSEQRATLISIYSSLGNLFYFVISLGYTLSNVSLDNALLSMLIGTIAAIILYAGLVQNNRNGQKKEEES